MYFCFCWEGCVSKLYYIKFFEDLLKKLHFYSITSVDHFALAWAYLTHQRGATVTRQLDFFCYFNMQYAMLINKKKTNSKVFPYGVHLQRFQIN
jgi:hypothetical protein